MKASRALTTPAITLFFVTPLIAEVLSGAQPPQAFFKPASWFFLTMLYGLGGLLCRELTCRWDKGWPTLLLLGAAYGVVEEGLVVASFFNPNHWDLGTLKGYDRRWGVNWVWSLDLTVYHSVISVGIPVLIVTMLFPSRRAQPWVGRRTLWMLSVVFVLHCLVMFSLLTVGLLLYAPPLVHWLSALMVSAALVYAARHAPRSPWCVPVADRPAPHPFWFGLVGFLGAAILFLHVLAIPQFGVGPVAAIGIMVLIVAVAYSLTMKMSHGRRVDDRHALALGGGALMLMALLAVLQEIGGVQTQQSKAGMSMASIVTVLLLVWLMLRTRRRERRRQEAAG